jgi:hypothetical protein
VGKTYEALIRSNKETVQGKVSLDDQLLSADPPADPLLPKVNGASAPETKYQLGDEEKIYNIKSSSARKKKLLSILNAGTIRDIFSYWYFLKISDPIRVRKINLLKYTKFVCYRILLEIKIVLSVYLDRAGNFISVNVSPQSLPSIKENFPAKPAVLDPYEFKKKTENMIHEMFNNFDQKKLESVFRDLFAIELYQNISCESGDMVFKNGQLLYEFTLKWDTLFSLFLKPTGKFIGISFSGDQKTWKQIIREHFSKESSFEINLFKNQK